MFMDKRTAKSVIKNLTSILGIGNDKFGFDGFFYTEQVNHGVSLEDINITIASNPDLTSYDVYKHFLLPVISLNIDKHMSIRWIYSTLAQYCTQVELKREYYKKAFEHYILRSREGFKDVEDVTEFYITVLTRESCCVQCKDYGDEKVYGFDKFLLEFPNKVRDCMHENSCHASISVISQRLYNRFVKDGKIKPIENNDDITGSMD